MRPRITGTHIALVVLAALVLLVVLFDWNWFRPAIERHLNEKSQREVRADDLHISLDSSLQPVVRLRGVHVQNAPWAADESQPFITAKEVQFTFDWATLFADVRLVHKLVLVGADVSLERRNDGLRNWRLTRPDDRGPGRMRILALETHDTRLALVHQGLRLDFKAASTDTKATDATTTDDTGLTQRIAFKGNFNDAPFEGDVLAGPVITMRDTGDFFRLRGKAQSRQTVVNFDGRLGDLLKLGGVDGQAQLAGPNLVQLDNFIPGVTWPPSHAYRAEAQITKLGDAMTARELKVTMGESDIAGDISHDLDDKRHTVKASLKSRRLRVADLLAPNSPTAARKADKGADTSTHVLPKSPLPLASLDDVDAQVDLQVATLQWDKLPDLQAVRTRLLLDANQLKWTLQDSRFAGGNVQGQFAIDNRDKPAKVQLELKARALQIETLLKEMPQLARVEGTLNGRLALKGQGNSVAAWLGSADGTFTADVDKGWVSQALDAKLALNAGERLKSFFVGDKPVAIRCGAVAVNFADGKGTTKRIVFDTDKTQVRGQGTVLLDEETWALWLTPHSNPRALLALNKSVVAKGNFRGFSFELADKNEPVSEGGGCD